MSYAMTKAAREAFLAETHVAVISVACDGRGPLTVPVWYRYEPGGAVRFVTGRNARKVAPIRRAGRLSLCVQSETAPYQFVSVEGPATVSDDPDFELDVRQVALRYLGKEFGEAYLAMTATERAEQGSVLVTLVPQRWISVDYGRMAEGRT
jgi:PPOX class probable F420-dependent enzyme